MTEYYGGLKTPVAFKPQKTKNGLGETISSKGIKQLRIAESEKYAHVTFFFNGQVEKPFKGEDRIIVPSPKVATYDKTPGMSAEEVTKKVIQKIRSKKYGLIILNYANPDMVGHTGNLKAAIKAVEKTDACVARVVEEMRKAGGTAIITADHGNCEAMTGKHKTSHTTNPVPFIIISEKSYRLRTGALGNIAPTILQLMGIKKPKEMTGKSLIQKN
jgi:2,3-bisphosphoglycerate-independent phosphoglycerate mutase